MYLCMSLCVCVCVSPQVCKLRGHTENVRVLRIKDDCSLMLSGSADGTFRLWDLTMQRCVQVRVCICVCVCLCVRHAPSTTSHHYAAVCL